MNGPAHEVLITGIGVVVEGDRPASRDLRAALDASRLAGVIAPAGASARTGGRDRKLLTPGDLMALDAARLAVEDAGGRTRLGDDWGCVCFAPSKSTREGELKFPFTAYRKVDGTPDTTAYRQAIDDGDIEVDPLGLLRYLDNSTSWWLCKHYGFGNVNLQLGQTLDADFWALVAAIDLVASGDCGGVLVGGFESITQSAVHLTGIRREQYGEDDPRVAGAAAFFTVERADRALGTNAYARVRVNLTSDAPDPRGDECCVAPGLTTAMRLVRYCADLRGGGAPALRLGALQAERLC